MLRILLNERVEGDVRRASGVELAALAERSSVLKARAEDALRLARDEALSRLGPGLGLPEPTADESRDSALERSKRSNPRARAYQQALSQLNRRELEHESAAMLSRLAAIVERQVSPEWESDDETGQIGPLSPIELGTLVDAVTEVSPAPDGRIVTGYGGDAASGMGHDYFSSPLFGLTHDEIERAVSSFDEIGYVVLTAWQVGFYGGDCNMRAMREAASVYVVSLLKEEILAARFLLGAPPGVATPCASVGERESASGGPPRYDALFRIRRLGTNAEWVTRPAH